MLNVLTSAQVTLLKNSPSTSSSLDPTNLFILKHGWAPATVRQYGAAVNKFFEFLISSQREGKKLPITPTLVYKFIFWCSVSSHKTVSTGTIARYLTGLKMWHTLHGLRFPAIDVHRIRLLLKACKKTEQRPPVRTRVGLTLEDVLNMSDKLTSDNLTDLTTKAIILVGFWGLARLGELTLHPDHPDVFVRRQDLLFSSDGRSASISITMAKTSRPGETQLLHLRAQPNRLDPLNVLHELLLRTPGMPNDPLFPGRFPGIPMSKSHVSRFLKYNGPQDATRWGGHSLRIGGASFQYDAGRSIPSLKKLGRWRSKSYKTYIHEYSRALHYRTRQLTRRLHF